MNNSQQNESQALMATN